MSVCTCSNASAVADTHPQLKLLGQVGDYMDNDDIELGVPRPSPSTVRVFSFACLHPSCLDSVPCADLCVTLVCVCACVRVCVF